jgi:hypothetical protein
MSMITGNTQMYRYLEDTGPCMKIMECKTKPMGIEQKS